jgi:hypothetical protein
MRDTFSDDPLARRARKIMNGHEHPRCDVCDEPIHGKARIGFEHDTGIWWIQCHACYQRLEEEGAAREQDDARE